MATSAPFPAAASAIARPSRLAAPVKETIIKLHKRGGFNWREVDVDSDPEIRRLYTDEVPVVFINGRKAFKYHMNEQEFLRKLAS